MGEDGVESGDGGEGAIYVGVGVWTDENMNDDGSFIYIYTI